jgi:hypothetical protein
MKREHEAALRALETELEKEQARQMDMMRAKLKERMKEADANKVRREIKVSMIHKAK